MVLRKTDIIYSVGIVEACDILFGQQAQEKLAEYVTNVQMEILEK